MFFCSCAKNLHKINHSINHLKEDIMATLDEVKQAITDEKTEVTAKITELSNKITELQTQISGGENVTPEQLSELKELVHGIFVA